MLRLIEPTRPQRFEVFTSHDDTLEKYGSRPGDEFVVSCDEFRAGEYHVLDMGRWGVCVARLWARAPGLVGRVVLPPEAKAAARELDPLPPEGLRFTLDAHGNLVEVDEGVVERCFGFDPKTCYGFGFINNIVAEERARFAAAWGQSVARRGVIQVSTVSARADGGRVPVSVLAVPSRSLTPRFSGWSGVTQPGEIVQVA
jgi:hypothetical protein